MADELLMRPHVVHQSHASEVADQLQQRLERGAGSGKNSLMYDVYRHVMQKQQKHANPQWAAAGGARRPPRGGGGRGGARQRRAPRGPEYSWLTDNRKVRTAPVSAENCRLTFRRPRQNSGRPQGARALAHLDDLDG